MADHGRCALIRCRRNARGGGVAELVTLARVEDVPPGAIYEAELDGRSLLVVNVEGDLRVIDALCTHLDGPLSLGGLEGYTISCPWHGSCFDVRDGSVANRPAKTALGTYEVTVEDGEIRVTRPE
jgi:nitrite reductase/ring-hydroxylating ferredoxin subunit